MMPRGSDCAQQRPPAQGDVVVVECPSDATCVSAGTHAGTSRIVAITWPIADHPGSPSRRDGAVRCRLLMEGAGRGQLMVIVEPSGSESGTRQQSGARGAAAHADVRLQCDVDIHAVLGSDRDAGWMHLTVSNPDDGTTLLIASLDADDCVRYIAAPVLYTLGLVAGGFDPPRRNEPAE